jgi:epoxyqueuosine reductase
VTADAVKRLAVACGFDLCGIASAEPFPELAGFSEWLARGCAGDMHYLARSEQARRDPRLVLPGARSVVVLGTLYNTDRPYSTEVADPAIARISRYAWGEDYHLVIRRRLDALIGQMAAAAGDGFDAKAYVDTGPVQERAFAQRAGVGWIGKNACLINPSRGSWFFLAVVLCNLPLAPDGPEVDHCGTCSLCLEACPTQAFDGPGQLDARRCLSYLTIELRGEIPGRFHRALGTHVFGCDICQEVCPFNHGAPLSADPAWQPRPALDGASVAHLAQLDDDQLRAAIRRSAIQRTGVAGLRRNLRVAQANLRDAGGS